MAECKIEDAVAPSHLPAAYGGATADGCVASRSDCLCKHDLVHGPGTHLISRIYPHFSAWFSAKTQHRAADGGRALPAPSDTWFARRIALHACGVDYLAGKLADSVCGASSGGFALLHLDLNGFEAINDNLDLYASDKLLKQVASRVRAAWRNADHFALLGGDEFAIVLPGN